MSITSAFANAVSGLNASARKADVVSQNVANALTEGYARRELALSSRNLGGNGAGVSIDGVNRVYSRTVLAERRLSDAAAGNAALRQGFFADLEAAIGGTGEQGSLTAEIDGLEAALIEATSRPDSSARLQATLDAAQGVAGKLNSLSDSVQQARMSADSEIATQVSTLNTALGDIDKLNGQILVQLNSGHDATALMDQRQVLVDRVAAIVPLREVPRENAQIALYTVGGAILLDGNPAEIGFSKSGVITADMTQASGALSGLTINGMAVRSTEDGLLGGGTLGALFAIRDELAVGAQDQLDAIARDLVERFEGSSVDTTLTSGEPGLFTDHGAALDLTDTLGLAGRIAVNAAVIPDTGGSLWRLRDGIGATSEGDGGDASLLGAMADALSTGRVVSSGSFVGETRSASGLAAEYLSQVSQARLAEDDTVAFSTARQSALSIAFAADGVDTDVEMQTLLQVEQAYAANAKMIAALDEMLQQLLGI